MITKDKNITVSSYVDYGHPWRTCTGVWIRKKLFFKIYTVNRWIDILIGQDLADYEGLKWWKKNFFSAGVFDCFLSPAFVLSWYLLSILGL